MESINTRIKDLRYQEGNQQMTQKDVAEALGIPASTINEYEKEGYYIPSNAIIKYCQFFNVSADYLLGLTNIKQPTNHKIEELMLSDVAIQKLADKKIDGTILSEIMENELFEKIMIDTIIYINGFVDETISRYNSIYDMARMQFSNTDALTLQDTVDKTTLEYVKINQDTLFSQSMVAMFLSILKDIKAKYSNRAHTSDMQNGLPETEQFLNAFQNASGSKEEKLSYAIMDMLKVKSTDTNTEITKELIEGLSGNFTSILKQSSIVEPNDRKRRTKTNKKTPKD